MRHLFALSFSALALVAGCSSSTAPPPAPAPVAPIANAITGSVMLRDPRQLSADTKVELKVVDVAQPSVVLAQNTISPANTPPIAFNLPIDTSKVDPKRTYAIEAVLIDGDRRYLPVLQYPVLTNKAPSKVDITVAPEPTPAEKLYDDFKKEFGKIGSLKSISGSSLGDTQSTAWDAFVSNGKVHVVREITDLDADKGRITMKMAYQNDKPWVVQKEESPAGSNKPYATTKVGWDDNGQLVLKERINGGQSSEVSDADAKALYDHAAQAFTVAQARVPAKK
jgi:putative lipoprotein